MKSFVTHTTGGDKYVTTRYELTNHLGNVMAVISDAPGGGTQPTVESLTDYYPFGMAMPGRSYNAYRYGFNSQENVPELGDGHTTAPYWEYNGRLGRRWNGTVNREYSWHYFNHTFTVFNKGMAFDPNSENEASVPSLISHSHPSTDFSKCLSWDRALETLSVNTKMLFMRMVLLKINMYGVWVIELYTYMTQLV